MNTSSTHKIYFGQKKDKHVLKWTSRYLVLEELACNKTTFLSIFQAVMHRRVVPRGLGTKQVPGTGEKQTHTHGSGHI